MRRALAMVALLGLALALGEDEVVAALKAHAQVEGYIAQVRQGGLVYQVAYRRPWVRIDWLEGPPYLKGSVLITDGRRVWSKGPKGGFEEGRAQAPDDPLSLLFADPEALLKAYRVVDPREEGGLWTFTLARREAPKDERQPAAWRITLNPKGHLPFRYQVLSVKGEVLAEAEYLSLKPTLPPKALFEVGR